MSIFSKKPKDKENKDIRVYEQWQLDEIVKCSLDPIYFILTYCKIIHKDRGLIPFTLYDYQIEYINMIHHNRFSIVMFPRQTGKTTTMCGYISWYVLFQSNKTVCVMANKEDTAKEVLMRLKDIISNLPEWLKPWIENWAATQIIFKNSNRVKISSSSESAVRGLSGNLIYLDEFAHISGGGQLQELFYTSVYPTIISGNSTKLILSSCVVANTIVYTKDGPAYISKYIGKDGKGSYEIPEYEVYGHRGPNKGSIFHNDGLKPTKTIYTSYTSIESSFNHKYLSYKDGSYSIRRAYELSKGDYIAIKKGLNIWGNNDDISEELKDSSVRDKNYGRLNDRYFKNKKIDKDLAYVLGAIIACGRFDKNNNIILATNNNIKNQVERAGIKCKIRGKDNRGIRTYVLHGSTLVKLCDGLGIKDIIKSHKTMMKHRAIPSRLFSISKDPMTGLIAGIMDSMMFIEDDNILFKFKNKDFLNQVRTILLNFGILLPVCRKGMRDINYIKRGYNMRLYKTTIGTCVKEANDIIYRDMHMARNTDINTGIDADKVPGSGDIFRKIYGKSLIISGSVVRLPKKDNVSRKFLAMYKAGVCNIPDEIKPLIETNDINTIWAPIIHISEGINEVYDFSMHSTNDIWGHSVIYNGVVGEQTPNGMDLFHKIYSKAIKKENQFKSMTITWDACPGRDEEFKNKTIQDIGQLQWDQEFDCKFVGSQATLIDPDMLSSIDNTDPIHVEWDGMLKVYEHALDVEDMEDNGWFYLISVDPCMGTRKDFGVAQVLLVKSNMDIKQVAVMSTNNKGPADFSNYVARLGKRYNMAKMIVETNGEAGATVCHILRNDIQYPEMVRLDKTGGFSSNSKTKREAYTALKIYIEHGYIKICDRNTINELYSFVKVGNTYKADGTNHDDHVTSLFPAVAYIRSNKFYGNIDDRSLNYKNISEFDTIDNGGQSYIGIRPSDIYNSEAIESLPEGKEKEAIIKLINRPNLDAKGPASIILNDRFNMLGNDMGHRFISGQQYVNGHTYAPGYDNYKDTWSGGDDDMDFTTRILI